MLLPAPMNDPHFGHGLAIPKPDRLTLATKFVMALHDACRGNPTSWRRISAISARTGIKGDDLERTLADVVAAGLVEQRDDDPSLITLTNSGWDFATT